MRFDWLKYRNPWIDAGNPRLLPVRLTYPGKQISAQIATPRFTTEDAANLRVNQLILGIGVQVQHIRSY